MNNKVFKIEANVDPQNHLAIVTKQSGKICQHLGQSTKSGKFLYPEEILFLLESGRLKLTWNSEEVTVEKAYALYLNQSIECTDPVYKVYTHLISNGYKVRRSKKLLKNDSVTKIARSAANAVHCTNDQFWTKLQQLGPKQCTSREPNEHFQTVFDLYLPNVKSLKKNPPNFQILIINGSEMIFPTIRFDETPIKLTAINDPNCSGIYRIGSISLPKLIKIE